MSIIFSSANRKAIERNVLSALNTEGIQLMSLNTLHSPRAVGDTVQDYLEQHISDCLPQGIATSINTSFARRSMADLAFEDIDSRYYVVDVKTHNLDTKFNMPNLTSVERLARFYGEPNNYFSLLLVSYRIENDCLAFHQCTFIPIEMLDWSCLTIGALGWGQIQIANSNNLTINESNTRKEWMLQLCDALDAFYPHEIAKITDRIAYFQNIRRYWEEQPT
jgi:hypothetical protein